MKTVVRVVVLAVAVAITTTSCTYASRDLQGGGSAAGATAQQQSVNVAVDPAVAALVPPGVKSRGSITVATDATYPPFEMFGANNKTIIGFDADLMHAAGEKMGLKVDMVNASFDSILTGIAAHRYDAAASSFSVTPARLKVVEMVTYLQGGAGIAVKPGNPLGLRMDPTAFCGRAIAAEAGSTQAIQQLPDISQQCQAHGKAPVHISLFPSQSSTILALVSGRVQAIMADSVALSYQSKLGSGRFVLAPGPIYEARPTGIALPKNSPLQPALRAAIKALYADGTVKRIAARWSVPDTSLISNPGA